MKILSVFAFLCTALFVSAQGGSSFPLFKDGKVASIYASDTDEPQIIRAVRDLQNDIKMVTGVKPDIIHDLKNAGSNVIIISSVNNPVVQELQKGGKLEEASGIDKKFESYHIKTLEKPHPNIDKALVVVGSDALGAVYGLYEISERIGVSPLYWWCDVTPHKQDEIILKDFYMLPKEPSVRYRGIFINDEEALAQWSGHTSKDKLNGHPSPEVYKRIFELLVRLKANTIWPAMLGTSSYFFEFKDENGIPINAKNANEYGIYIGTSHCENMARNNLAEWHDWAEANRDKYDAKGIPVFDYTVNPKAIEAYWQLRLDESKDFKMIYTIGIRGVSDSPFMSRNLKNPTLEDKVNLLQTVIDRQREMIKETFGAEDAVPQIFVPYEETGELYNGESKDGTEKCKGLDVPEDVTLVWTEDNYGYTRQLPFPKDRQRLGSNGLYYHLAYQGGNTYDWLTTTPLQLMQEQLRKAHDAGAQKFWMVNVGDVKPAELGLQFYMSLAYDINSYYYNTTKEFLVKHASQNYGVEGEAAMVVADIITNFHQLTTPQKPEFMTPFWTWDWHKSPRHQFYSLFDFGDEVQIRIEDYTVLENSAKHIYEQLDPSRKAPFWHLVYYPIRSTRLMLEKTTYYRKNHAYAKQGRFASVEAYRALSEKAEREIQKDLVFYNKELSDGKWDSIMDPYALYNLKERVHDVASIPNNFVYEKKYKADAMKGIGSVCEGQETGEEKVILQFSSFENNSRFVDVFNRESKANEWSIESDADWVKISKSKGKVIAEERIWITVDWGKLAQGTNEAKLTVTGSSGYSKTYPVRAANYEMDVKERSFVEGNGFVSIEAEHYTIKHPGNNNSSWKEYKHYGYVGSSMFVKGGGKVEENHKENAARIEYSVYFSSTGTFYGELYRIPTLNEGKGRTTEIAVGVNDETPQVLSGIRHKGRRKKVTLIDGSAAYLSWNKNVVTQMERLPFKIEIKKPGYHIIKIYQVNTNIGIDRIVICTNKQAETALKRSVIACPESYNTIVPYVPQKRSSLPGFSKNVVKVSGYPKLSPIAKTKFNFAMYGTPEAFGYVPVNHKTIYDPNSSVFGWRASDLAHIRAGHNESTIGYPFWQRDYFFSDKEAIFYSRVKQGKYRLVIYIGDVSSIDKNLYSYRGRDFHMSLLINGEQVVDNEIIKEGHPEKREVELEIGEEEMLELKLSGNWGISVLEVIPL